MVSFYPTWVKTRVVEGRNSARTFVQDDRDSNTRQWLMVFVKCIIRAVTAVVVGSSLFHRDEILSWASMKTLMTDAKSAGDPGLHQSESGDHWEEVGRDGGGGEGLQQLPEPNLGPDLE